MKTLPTHLDRLDAALRRQGHALRRHQLLEVCAAAFGYHNSNQMTAAAKAGALNPPGAEPIGTLSHGATELALLRDPVAGALYAVEAARLSGGRTGVSPYGGLITLPGAGEVPKAAAPGLVAGYHEREAALGAQAGFVARGHAIPETGGHPAYGREDWRRDVDAGDTALGYHDWVSERLHEDAERAEEASSLPTLVQWDEEHPSYPRCDWEYEVANGDTRRGYGDWVEACIERDHEDGVTFLTNGCCENAHGTPALLARFGLRGQDGPDGFYPLTKGEEKMIAEDDVSLPNGATALFGYSVLQQGKKWACPVIEFHHGATREAALAARAEVEAYVAHVGPKFAALGGKVMTGEVQDDRICVNVLVPFATIMKAHGDVDAWRLAFAKHAMPQGGPRVTARFHPQAWVNDNAVSVDPEGAVEWDVTHVIATMSRAQAEAISDDDYNSDNLRDDPEAPRWIREWTGPFRIEVEESVQAYFEAYLEQLGRMP